MEVFDKKIITLEGLDGSGKTTVSKLLKEKLLQDFMKVELIREPGGTETSEAIRELILKPGLEKMTQLLLFNASRVENINKLVNGKYKDAQFIIFDRFFYSTLVYQGTLNNIPENTIQMLNAMLFHNIKVHKHFYIKCSIETLEQRLNDRNEVKNHYDSVHKSKKQAMLQRYEELAKEGFLITINGEQEPNKVVQDIIEHLC